MTAVESYGKTDDTSIIFSKDLNIDSQNIWFVLFTIFGSHRVHLNSSHVMRFKKQTKFLPCIQTLFSKCCNFMRVFDRTYFKQQFKSLGNYSLNTAGCDCLKLHEIFNFINETLEIPQYYRAYIFIVISKRVLHQYLHTAICVTF